MPASPPQATNSIRNDEVEIYYSQYGKGPLIVMLHGFPDHDGTYAAQVKELSRDHLVVTPRLRGYPPSSVPADVSQYALPTVASDIAAIIEHFGGPAIVIGHDWGGAVAQAVAIGYPQLVRGLGLLNAPLLSTFASLVNGDPEQQDMSAYTLPYLRYSLGDDKNVAFVTSTIRDPEWRSVIATYLEDSPIEGMMAYYKANYAAPPYRPEAPAGYRFDMPALIVWGTEEEYFAPSALDGMPRYFTGGLRVTLVPGAGHWVHRDAAQQVNREIRSWLATLTGAAPGTARPLPPYAETLLG